MIHGQDAKNLTFAVAFKNFALFSIANKIFMRQNCAFRVAGGAGGVNYDARIIFVEICGEFGSVWRNFIAESSNIVLSDGNFFSFS